MPNTTRPLNPPFRAEHIGKRTSAARGLPTISSLNYPLGSRQAWGRVAEAEPESALDLGYQSLLFQTIGVFEGEPRAELVRLPII